MNKFSKIWKKRHISKNNLYLFNGYYLDRSKFKIKRIKINLFILGAQNVQLPVYTITFVRIPQFLCLIQSKSLDILFFTNTWRKIS